MLQSLAASDMSCLPGHSWKPTLFANVVTGAYRFVAAAAMATGSKRLFLLDTVELAVFLMNV
jgi:hypothetical protein